MKLLIIDDSVSIRKRVVLMLQEIPGIQKILEASDISLAKQLIRMENPDIVILDISLNGESGIDILKGLNKQSNEHPIVIMLTNYATSWYRKKCMGLGAEFFLDKSQEFDQLSLIVTREQMRIALRELNKENTN